MKTITRLLLATLVVASAGSSYAQSPKSMFRQFVNVSRKGGNSGQSIRNTVQNQFARHLNVNPISQPRHSGGHLGSSGYPSFPVIPEFPGQHCGTPNCPPPPPVCYIYMVYYYDCHNGWQLYGTYHHIGQAQAAIHMLQAAGYRAYLKKVAR